MLRSVGWYLVIDVSVPLKVGLEYGDFIIIIIIIIIISIFVPCNSLWLEMWTNYLHCYMLLKYLFT